MANSTIANLDAIAGIVPSDAEIIAQQNGETVAKKATALQVTAQSFLATNLKSGDYTVGTDDPNEAYGGIIYVMTAAVITYPAAAVGMNFSIVTIGSVAVSGKPNALDMQILDGVTLDDGDKATNTSTSGDIITVSYHSVDGWYAVSSFWTDGGA